MGEDYMGPVRILRLLAPATSALLVLAAAPIAAVLGFSVLAWTQRSAPSIAYLGNFSWLFEDEWFWNSLKATLLFVVLATVLELTIGTLIALMLEMWPRVKRCLRLVLVLPLVLSPAVVAIVWRVGLNETSGPFTCLVRSVLGPDARPLSSPLGALLSIVAIDVWQWTPLVVLLVSLSLDEYRGRYGELTACDRLPTLAAARFVWIPLVLPSLGVATLLRTVDCVRAFDTIHLATAGGPGAATEVLSIYVHRQLIRFGDFGHAAAASVVLLAIASALFVAGSGLFLRRWRENSPGGHG